MSLTIKTLLELLIEEKSYLDNKSYDIAWISRTTKIGYQVVKNISDGKSKSPSYHTVEAIAHAFGLSISYFESKTEDEARTFIHKGINIEIEPITQDITQRISLLSSTARTDLMRMLRHIETSERVRQSQIINALCIDDDYGSLLMLRGTLEDSNIRHEWYGDSHKGYKQLIQGGFNVAFIDLMMPIMSGYEIAQAIRQHEESNIKYMVLVAVTAYAITPEQQKQIKESGFDEIINKPFDPLEFPIWIAEFKERYKDRL